MNSRIDNLEAQNREHDKIIKTLEKRNDEMEKFVRNSIMDSRKQQTGVFISIALAIFGAILNVVMNLII